MDKERAMENMTRAEVVRIQHEFASRGWREGQDLLDRASAGLPRPAAHEGLEVAWQSAQDLRFLRPDQTPVVRAQMARDPDFAALMRAAFADQFLARYPGGFAAGVGPAGGSVERLRALHQRQAEYLSTLAA
jgi:hypothetical protein